MAHESSKYKKHHGVVILLDALGTKGIWRDNDPKGYLYNWDNFVEVFDEDKKDYKELDDIDLDMYAFSDTIIITIKKKDLQALLEAAAEITSVMIKIGLMNGIYLRGCVSVGIFYESKRMVLGPAIDEAATYYDKSNWIGAFATPSTYSALLRMTETNEYPVMDTDYIPYNIPMKEGIMKTWAIVLLNESATSHTDQPKSIIEFIHDKLEKSGDVGGAEKWKNTLDFMYFLEKKKNLTSSE